MPEYTIRSKHASVVAIDQHARSVTVSAICLSTGEMRGKKLTGCPGAADIVSWAEEWLAPPIWFIYESGPCGFQLARDIRLLGHDCDMIAVSSIPRSAEDRRIKDDRRDARRLLDAAVSPSRKIRPVWVPSEECEAARDLVRAYSDMVVATKRLKFQFSGMLLRHGVVWDERTPAGNLRATWTRQYVKWARSVRLPQPAENETLKFYLEAALSSMERCEEMRRRISSLCLEPRFKPYVDALTRLKGVDEITALTYVATVDDFSRFRNGRSVSKYFGLTPSRNDSGEKVGHHGSITKAGDTTVRRAVIEGLASLPNHNGAAKWQRKGHGVSAAVEAEAVKCNLRHARRYKDLVKAGKKPNVAKTAIASEMVRDMWAIGLIVKGELEG